MAKIGHKTQVIETNERARNGEHRKKIDSTTIKCKTKNGRTKVITEIKFMICDVNEFAITLISNQINDAFLQHFIGDTSKQASEHFISLRYVTLRTLEFLLRLQLTKSDPIRFCAVALVTFQQMMSNRKTTLTFVC